MSRSHIAAWILVVLLFGCSTPVVFPTFTPVLPTPQPTVATMPTVTPDPTATATPLPAAPKSTPLPLPTTPPPSTSIPLPTWANEFQLGATVVDIPAHSPLMLDSGMTWVQRQVTHTTGGNASLPVINTAHDQRLRILLTVAQDEDRILDGTYQAEYVSYLAALADAGADGIEVGYEPNMSRGGSILQPGEYTRLLCEAYNAIKGANPETLVISAAPVPTGYYGGCSAEGCDDLPWLKGLAEAGAAQCLELVGASHRFGATSPEESAGHPADQGMGHHSWYFWPTVEAYSDIFNGTRSLAFTSFGYLSFEGLEESPESLQWAEGTTTANQATWTVKAVEMAIESDAVGMLIIWNLDYTGQSALLSGSAIIRPDGSCPTCEALGTRLDRY